MVEYPPIVQLRPYACLHCDLLHAALQYTLDEAKKLGYDVIDLEGDLATRADLEATISEEKPVFFHAAGHGSYSSFHGQHGTTVLRVGLNEEVCAGMIVYLLSCLTGRELGPAIIDAGGWAYIGYRVSWGAVVEGGDVILSDPYLDMYAKGFFEGSNAIVFAFLNGLTAEEAQQAGHDKYTEWIDYWTTSDDPNASECIQWLASDRDNCVLLGDSTAKITTPLPTPPPTPSRLVPLLGGAAGLTVGLVTRNPGYAWAGLLLGVSFGRVVTVKLTREELNDIPLLYPEA